MKNMIIFMTDLFMITCDQNATYLSDLDRKRAIVNSYDLINRK